MKLALSAVMAVASLAASAPQTLAAPGPRSAQQCFRISQMEGHRVADNRTLYVGAGRSDVYRLDMSGACLAGASRSDPLVVESTAGSNVVCGPLDINLRLADSGGGPSCIIKHITRLTPDEVAALPPNLKP